MSFVENEGTAIVVVTGILRSRVLITNISGRGCLAETGLKLWSAIFQFT